MTEYPDLLRAIWADDAKAVQLILDSGVDVDMLDPDGRTALMDCAGREERFGYLRTLILSGANVNSVDPAGWTPLHFAAQAHLPETVEYLLIHGALPDTRDNHGNTPLRRAVGSSRGRGEVIALLRAAGADPQIENNHGKTPLGLARLIGNYDVAQFFADLP